MNPSEKPTAFDTEEVLRQIGLDPVGEQTTSHTDQDTDSAQQEYEAHPYADCFPLMEGADFEVLCKSIAERGLLEPIVLFEDKILDGRNRYRGCQKTVVVPRFEEYKGNDPLGFVFAKNVERRHLTPSQRGIAAARMANLNHGGNRRNDQAAKLPVAPVTQEQAAEAFRISERTVRDARKVLDQGVPELAQAVTAGRIPVSSAVKLTTLSPDKQAEVVGKVSEGASFSQAIRQINEVYGTMPSDPLESPEAIEQVCQGFSALAIGDQKEALQRMKKHFAGAKKEKTKAL